MIYGVSKPTFIIANFYNNLCLTCMRSYTRAYITIIDDPHEFDLIRNPGCNLKRTLSFSRPAEISMKIMAPQPYFIHALLFMRRHTRQIPPRDCRTFLRERHRWMRCRASLHASHIFKIFFEIMSCEKQQVCSSSKIILMNRNYHA